MGVSTDGQICFGVALEEESYLPWHGDEWEGDIEDWWLFEVCGYERPFELFDEVGNYINGVKPDEDKLDEYFALRSAFREKHPMPVELVNCCSGEYPMWIAAVPHSVLSASRGFPLVFNPSDLHSRITSQDVELLGKFCEDYLELTDYTMQWYLSSYWG
jgi:hypothetical protein